MRPAGSSRACESSGSAGSAASARAHAARSRSFTARLSTPAAFVADNSSSAARLGIGREVLQLGARIEAAVERQDPRNTASFVGAVHCATRKERRRNGKRSWPESKARG